MGAFASVGRPHPWRQTCVLRPAGAGANPRSRCLMETSRFGVTTAVSVRKSLRRPGRSAGQGRDGTDAIRVAANTPRSSATGAGLQHSSCVRDDSRRTAGFGDIKGLEGGWPSAGWKPESFQAVGQRRTPGRSHQRRTRDGRGHFRPRIRDTPFPRPTGPSANTHAPSR